MKEVKLICTINSHNKFYTLKEKGNGYFTALWGAIGTSPQSLTYPMSKWDSTIKSKLAKGYIDVSENKLSIEDIFKQLDKLALKFQ